LWIVLSVVWAGMLVGDEIGMERWEGEVRIHVEGGRTGRGLIYRSGNLRDWQPAHFFLKRLPRETTVLSDLEAVQFYRVEFTNYSVPEDFVWIAPGVFLMGSPEGEAGRGFDEGPRREVWIRRGFWMCVHEVTVAEYELVMGENPSMSASGSLHPVENVSYEEAMEYCVRRTVRDRAAGLIPGGAEYRLPSEAEWEYACRAGGTTRYNFGEDAGLEQLSRYGWYVSNSGSRTQPVKRKWPNAWGLYDVHGNVFEWCLDYYGPYPGGDRAGYERHHVYRGGSWFCEPPFLRCASRHPSSNVKTDYIGFRVVLGGEPDAVLEPVEVEALGVRLSWVEDGTAVEVTGLSSSPEVEVRYSTWEGDPTPVFGLLTPPWVTNASTVRVRGFRKNDIASPVERVVIGQVTAPVSWVEGGMAGIEEIESGAIGEYALRGSEEWQAYEEALALAAGDVIRFRVRKSGLLTSAEVTVVR
jgi:formylglycine-generating enzyme required for sulfatase activity